MVCDDAVFPEPLFKNHTVICINLEEIIKQPYRDNLRLFNALTLPLYGNQELEGEIFEIFFPSRMDGLSPSQFQGVQLNDIPNFEDFHSSIFFSMISIL